MRTGLREPHAQRTRAARLPCSRQSGSTTRSRPSVWPTCRSSLQRVRSRSGRGPVRCRFPQSRGFVLSGTRQLAGHRASSLRRWSLWRQAGLQVRASTRFPVNTRSQTTQIFSRRTAVALDAAHLPPATRSGRNRTDGRMVDRGTPGGDSADRTLEVDNASRATAGHTRGSTSLSDARLSVSSQLQSDRRAGRNRRATAAADSAYRPASSQRRMPSYARWPSSVTAINLHAGVKISIRHDSPGAVTGRACAPRRVPLPAVMPSCPSSVQSSSTSPARAREHESPQFVGMSVHELLRDRCQPGIVSERVSMT